MANMSPEQKRARIRASFEAKITILWGWARDGVPDGAKVPTTRSAFRRWVDADAGLVNWSDDAVDSPSGKNADLAKEYEEALAAVRKRMSGSKVARLSDAAAEVVSLRAMVDSLTRQNAALIGRVDGLERDKLRLEDVVRGRHASLKGGG